jgi:hypothetical protein
LSKKFTKNSDKKCQGYLIKRVKCQIGGVSVKVIFQMLIAGTFQMLVAESELF